MSTGSKVLIFMAGETMPLPDSVVHEEGRGLQLPLSTAGMGAQNSLTKSIKAAACQLVTWSTHHSP